MAWGAGMSALTTYLASDDCRDEVKVWLSRAGMGSWLPSEEHIIETADAALNAVCEQLQQRDGQHEVQLMRADNLITQRDEAERKWRHAEAGRNAACEERVKDKARIRELEAENERLKEVVGTARAFLDANPALNGTGPLRGDVEAYEQESKPTDVWPALWRMRRGVPQ